MAITQNTSFSFRLADSLKQEAFQVIENYGFTPSQVFNLFLTEIAKTKTIPVNLSYLKPNAETLRAMQEAENNDLDVISPAQSQESIMESLIKK
ncbi:type II toxin-antitoxin system RelB/DinJ family antitoxin [Rodentibacter heidelbergensis]|uniref:Antitoxin n=1 Tax=Rodentibacter heidelbergensis TaxID=1908258 RepID=A0A1V3I8W4_9PAST|nr:type II toxin-antitoxin system RelB/DinJ family antitoxin [Rodentibacter heidelbergensis]OOF36398.1 antitoxin [Rodentibacter heidelbergensis]